jgi:hypothetical protein
MGWWPRRRERRSRRRELAQRHRSPDDPRIVALRQELTERRAGYLGFPWDQEDALLVWSGPLPPGVDDTAAVNALVREKWWVFNGQGVLHEVVEDWAVEQLTWLIGHDQAYDSELLPEARAAELAARFVAFIPEPRRWFTNGDAYTSDRRGSMPLTDFTFEGGFVAVAEGRAWILWINDED